jgi:Protein of unknown function (DUF1186)
VSHPSYSAILQKFSELDDPYDVAAHDLLALGITAEMIPDLIETILDEQYYGDDYAEEGWPHLFAYIALGQLKTPAAIDGLIAGVKKWAHSDWFEWFCEGMPQIFGRIGSVAIPALIELLQDKNLDFYARTSALQYLPPIVDAVPEERDRCITAIVKELEQFEDNDPEFNGYIVMCLVADLKAVEVSPTIEAAYAADHVDYQFVGDWEDVQVSLGLLPERITPRPKHFLSRVSIDDRDLNKAFARQSHQIESYLGIQDNRIKNADRKKKAKRKQEKKSRQKNRRK